MIEKQILELKISKHKRKLCQDKIGQYVLVAFEKGEIKDDELNSQIEKIISEVKVTDKDIRDLGFF